MFPMNVMNDQDQAYTLHGFAKGVMKDWNQVIVVPLWPVKFHNVCRHNMLSATVTDSFICCNLQYCRNLDEIRTK